MSADEVEFDLDVPDLRGFLERVKDADPKMATAVRRELRASGDEIIADIRQILNGPKPGTVRRTGSEYRLIVPRDGRLPYMAKRAIFDLGEGKSGGVSDLRAQIAAGLRTRVATGKSRQSISIRTNGPRNAGYNMALVWQRSMFRHPMFGHENTWVYQAGQPYFFEPLKKGQTKVRERIANVIDEAITRLAQP